MIDTVKDIIQTPFIEKRIKNYYEKLDRSYESYHHWIRGKEDAYVSAIKQEHSIFDFEAEKDPLYAVRVVEYRDCSAIRELECLKNPGITIFVNEKTSLSERGVFVMADYLNKHPESVLCYGDEDEWNSNCTVRMAPWYKPEFSPELLLGFFYFGDVFAVRNEAVFDTAWMGSSDYHENIYDFCLNVCFNSVKNMRQQIGHINYVVYHSRNIEFFGLEEKFDVIKRKYDKRLYDLSTNTYVWNGNELVEDRLSEVQEQLTSIVIPSKDHPEVLEKCLISIERFSKNEKYEIIVVDNGSNEENKEQYEKLGIKYRFNYIYNPQEFNFSAMCNQGASVAKGQYILFLNDDIEVRQSRWLQMMKRHAAKSYVGAVGAKLYYPESKMIQHVGITNIKLGPVHKLQFLEDQMGYYNCYNIVDRDVLAVTGACLMVKKDKWQMSQGLDEDFAVAFNDVDFCFRLYEMGYYNVVCNGIHFWHHESLSRGADETEEKQIRLKKEREKLYRAHPGLYGIDPFYHPYMLQEILDTNLSLEHEYHHKKEESLGKVSIKKNALKPNWENECLMISMEYAGDLDAFNTFTKTDSSYAYIQGYSFVLGVDNACFEFSILLQAEDNTIYQINYDSCYRPDLDKNLEEEYHANMNGFAFVFEKSSLPSGRYRVGVFAKCMVNRMRLYRFTNKYLEI